MIRCLLIVALAGLAGCVATKPLTSAEVTAKTAVQDSTFDAAARYTGPAQSTTVQRNLLESDRITWRWRVFVDKATRQAVRQLYVEIWHQSRNSRNYSSASLEGGVQLKTTRIGYEPRCNAGGGLLTCTHTETIGVEVPEAAWSQALTRDLPIRLNSQAGVPIVLTIPATYTAAVSAAIPQP